MKITAYDLDFDGAINSGAGATYLHASVSGMTIGIGASSKNMHITDGELGKVTAGSLYVDRAGHNNQVYFNAVTNGNSDSFGNMLVYATGGTGEVSFTAGASSFNMGLELQAAKQVAVQVDVTTT